MITSNQSVIIRTKDVDDGTTLGLKVYQTADGRWWKESPYMSPDSLGTGDQMAYKIGDIIRW